MSIGTAQTALVAAARVAAADKNVDPLVLAGHFYEWLESKREVAE